MRDTHEEDAISAARAFRPNVRPLVIAGLANVIVAALFLGVPYMRGRSHADASLRAFSRFAGCLLGGQPRSEPGLLLPAGERAHFAGQVLHAKADWPARCRPALRAVAPPEALFVWPSVKQAGADVRAIVSLLDRELLQLARNRAAGKVARVPTRPLLAVAKLQGMLSVLASAVDDDAVRSAEALTFPKPASVIEPARLPLMAGQTSALTVWAADDGLRALALDARGVSVLRVEGGKLDRARVKRTSLVRAGLRAWGEPLLAFAMAEDRCAKDEQRCVRRTTGFAYIEADAANLPFPIWLAGHPGSRIDRALHVGLAGRVDLLARATPEGALEVRRFTAEAREATEEKAEPIAPASRHPLPAAVPPGDALLLDGQPPAAAYAVADATGMQAFALRYGDEGVPGAEGGAAAASAPLALGAAQGEGAWIEACATEQPAERIVAFGTRSELAIARLGADGAVTPLLAPAPIAVGAVLPRDEARRDRLRLLCGPAGSTLFALTEARELLAVRCTAAGCERGPQLARDVAGFDAVLSGEHALVAYTRRGEPQIAVLRVDARGAPIGAPQTPAPCWDPAGGLCGQPTFAQSGSRLLLCARDGADLLALESNDGGQRWEPLLGLQRGAAISTDPNAPLDQHRLRKGLQ